MHSDPSFEAALSEKPYSKYLLTVVGSIFTERDLMRVQIHQARACFILPSLDAIDAAEASKEDKACCTFDHVHPFYHFRFP